jgi:hypothetical protein
MAGNPLTDWLGGVLDRTGLWNPFAHPATQVGPVRSVSRSRTPTAAGRTLPAAPRRPQTLTGTNIRSRGNFPMAQTVERPASMVPLGLGDPFAEPQFGEPVLGSMSLEEWRRRYRDEDGWVSGGFYGPMPTLDFTERPVPAENLKPPYTDWERWANLPTMEEMEQRTRQHVEGAGRTWEPWKFWGK